MGMRNSNSPWLWLAALVLGHLVISIAHGAAHAGAQVPMSAAANAFVFVVILAGPLAGLALTFASMRLGSWVIAFTMAGSLVFGLVNHFLLVSPDHVAHVASEWRPLFGVTAALLAATEGLASALAIRVAHGVRRLA
jgi:hypothetical protein